MRKKRLFTAILAMLVLECIMVGSTLAYWTVSGSPNNRFMTTGILDGQLLEDYDEPKSVYPGDVIKRVVNVKNAGGLDMITRIKMEKAWENNLSADNILIEYNDKYWLDGKDGYYYYKGILKPGATTVEPLFKEFRIGADTGNVYQGVKASITVKMECLQAGGNSINSWGKSYADIGVRAPAPKSDYSTATFDEDGDGFSFSSGFFNGFAYILPGETCVQEITVENEYDKPVTIFLRAQNPSQSVTGDVLTRTNELLTHATIEVMDQRGRVLYSGPVVSVGKSGSRLRSNISLGSFRTDEARDLTISLSLPPELDNEYQNLMGKVEWIFSARGEDSLETTEIDEADVPLVTIGDSTVPMGNLPLTGGTETMRWMMAGIILTAIALCFLFAMYVRARRLEA